jgi:hypothetical protein
LAERPTTAIVFALRSTSAIGSEAAGFIRATL